jgi:hypothetical protein
MQKINMILTWQEQCEIHPNHQDGMDAKRFEFAKAILKKASKK